MEPPSGETRADFYRRAELAVMDALQAAAGTPLIVSHGGIFDALRAHRADDRLNVNNCALYMFRWGGDEGRPEWLMGELP
ncbi:MAG: histidine phosphatase family protein, partial [Rhodospirillales bacterium]|nr:histidine phosphatase family protein [Rhodospirillales bacterium]